MSKRRICIVTGTRADYGHLYWLMHEIKDDSDLELKIIVSAMHLSPEFGLTYRDIENDGFTIDQRVEMLLSADTSTAIAKSIGLGVIGFSDAFYNLRPDLVVILGDRYEALAAAQAAMIARVPIAHIHGGELTEGATDDQIRHAITKLSHLHFTAAEIYKKRVVQLGEQPDRVHNVGALALEHLNRKPLLSKSELEHSLDFKFSTLNFLVTFHNSTLKAGGPEKAFLNLAKALENFPEAKIIFTRSNSDAESRILNQLIDQFQLKHEGRVKAFTSLGTERYLAALAYTDVIIGNSSSGLIEAPFFKKPTVNIGERQRGRLLASSVISCDESAESIIAAIQEALSPEFQLKLQKVESPYGLGDAAVKIKETLKKSFLPDLINKKFYDL